MRAKVSFYNIMMLFLQQVIVAVCGLIVPRLIIGTYGSAVNGTISSITQFLSYIELLEAGLGGVITSSLYRPLAEKKSRDLNGVINATERFFRKIAKIFIIYLLLIAVIFPVITRQEFTWIYSFSLVLIISTSTFFQYYFGITYQLLLQADQKVWYVAGVQSMTTIITLVITIICAEFGMDIHYLKLFCAFAYVLRPLLLSLYVHKNYNLDKKCPPDNNAIKQRWDGFAHHIAYIVHYNTDVVLLTLFTNMLEVSVYSIYYNIISNIYKVINSVTRGISASVGNMIAKGERDKLSRTVDMFETMNMILISIFYTSTAILIVPFVSVYTKGVTDVNYSRYLFALILILSESAYGLREPYDMVIFAAGHFKQTKKGAYQEAIINVSVSIILVQFLGIVGVAIGTLTAMIVRTLQYVFYLKNNIMRRDVSIFLKKFAVNFIVSVLTCILFNNFFTFRCRTYLEWIVSAALTFAVVLLIVMSSNLICFNKTMKNIIDILKYLNKNGDLK